jgi:CheY-like chemotaxis protein
MKLGEAKILVVDDESVLCEIFTQWLTDAGCTYVRSASDGEAALVLLDQVNFDLLISDVRMPELDGLGLVRRMAETIGLIPSIIFVSGFSEVDEREMYALGVEAFLSKPLTSRDLLQVVKKALAERSELWTVPMSGVPRQFIDIELEDFGEEGHSFMHLGRGGFSTYYPGLLSVGKVAFRCRFRHEGRQITGQGYVRWRSKAEDKIGVEFAYLDASCRAFLLEEIAASDSRAFIPQY